LAKQSALLGKKPASRHILQEPENMKGLNIFQGAEHAPFSWPAGPSAVLLVHGFPGTPAEMRPLGELFRDAGWSTYGLLLPGFGAQIDTLFERRYADWLTAVEEALVNLQQKHGSVLMVGYSMGAALAIQAAVRQVPSGLILLAPFWQLAPKWQQYIGVLLKPFFRQVRPFKKADFTDPGIRRGVSNLLSELDLDDPDVQQTLRDLTIPVSMFEQLHLLGQAAYNLAPQISSPTLIIQGTSDEVARLGNTRRLLQRFPGPLSYVQLEAGHDLVRPDQAGWARLEHVVLDFARAVS
jgi:carboxylesterase